MKKITLFLTASAFIISACSTTEKVAVNQTGDAKLSCSQIDKEFAKLDAIDSEASGNKGVNGTNVAAALFFWPAAVGNYMDADKAEDLSRERRQHLVGIYDEKGCS